MVGGSRFSSKIKKSFAKKRAAFEDVKKLFDVDPTKEKLIDVCLTRCVARIDGLVVFETFFTNFFTYF